SPFPEPLIADRVEQEHDLLSFRGCQDSFILNAGARQRKVGCRAVDSEGSSMMEVRSRDQLGRRLRTIARIAAGCRPARADEGRRFPSARDPQQITVGQIMLLVALWALGVAAWRLAWRLNQ